MTSKSIIKRYIEEVVNTGNTTRIKKYISEGYTEIHEGKAHKLGIKGAREHVEGVRKTYPDLKLTIEKQIAEGEWVATVYTMTGTQKGEWLGIKPTGKQIKVTGVNIDRVKNGKILEHGGAANLLKPLLAIGAIKFVG
jgi:predicted ester cyclase